MPDITQETPADAKYIESKRITSETDLENGFTAVNFITDDGTESTEQISNLLLPHIKTDEPIDASALQELTMQAIEKPLLAVLRNYDPRVEDLKPLLTRVGNTMLRNIERADDLFYGLAMEDRRISVYDRILMENAPDIPSGK